MMDDVTDAQIAFAECTSTALAKFHNTIGKCVALCAYISESLKDRSVEHSVALGSLSCNGIKTFQYQKPFPVVPTQSMFWDGHAWIEFPNDLIGEPSLFRTARAMPPNSNIRMNLQKHGLINKGAIIITSRNALKDYGLKYKRMSYLNEATIPTLINGLKAINSR